VTVQCFDSTRGAMRTPREISEEILAAVEPVLATVATRGK
jgi:hypothetical protein